MQTIGERLGNCEEHVDIAVYALNEQTFICTPGVRTALTGDHIALTTALKAWDAAT